MNTIFIVLRSSTFQSTPSVGRATLNTIFIALRSSTFQSTPSVGRATFISCGDRAKDRISIHALRGEGDCKDRLGRQQGQNISIHALRGEGDLTLAARTSSCRHFNPRPPWGGRPKQGISFSLVDAFQSTPSVGRATVAQAAGFDIYLSFQSTPSVGRATSPVWLSA